MINRRLLDGFNKLRNKFPFNERETSVETKQSNRSPNNKDKIDCSVKCQVSSYEPLANIRLKMLKQSIKKYKINNNESQIVQEQQSGFDGQISRCSYKVIDFDGMQQCREIDEKEMKQQHLNTSHRIQQQTEKINKNKNNINTATSRMSQTRITKSSVKDRQNSFYSTSKECSSFYNFQSNELSTKMSFFNLNKKEKNQKSTQFNFFKDHKDQEIYSNHSLSSLSQSSFLLPPSQLDQLDKTGNIINTAKIANTSNVNSGINKSKLQKIKLQLHRPKSQDCNLRSKGVVYYNGILKQDQIQFNWTQLNMSVDNFDTKQSVYPHLSPTHKSQDQKAYCSFQENQIPQSFQQMLNQSYDGQSQNSSSTDNIQQIQSSKQYKQQNLQKGEQQFIKIESNDCFQNQKILFDDSFNQQIHNNEVFKNYFTSYTNFIGRKLSNSTQRQEAASQRNSKKNISCPQKYPLVQLSQLQSMNIQELKNNISKEFSQSRNKQFEIKNTKIQVEGQKNKMRQIQRKYSQPNGEQKVEQQFEIQCLSYRSVIKNINKSQPPPPQLKFQNEQRIQNVTKQAHHSFNNLNKHYPEVIQNTIQNPNQNTTFYSKRKGSQYNFQL